MFWRLSNRKLHSALTLHGKIWHFLKVKNLPGSCVPICHRCFSKLETDNSARWDNIVPVFLSADQFSKRLALVDQHGSFTYDHILHHSISLGDELLTHKASTISKSTPLSLEGERVAFLCENDISYVVAKWAIWMAGGVAVPLCKSHPQSELEYFVEDSHSSILVSSEGYDSVIGAISQKFNLPHRRLKKEDYSLSCANDVNAWLMAKQRVTESNEENIYKACINNVAENQYKNKAALIIYTSGTTGKPKGVVMTHGNLHAMMSGMIESWGWSENDRILHVLPLHHVHGIVNVLMTSLICGATCVMLPKFEPSKVWSYLTENIKTEDNEIGINVFMAVPTVYAKLIEYYDTKLCNKDKENVESSLKKENIRSACTDRIRLMVSGSAALPQPIMERWKDITGHTLLERYGMTETGMVLTNPLNGERIPGCVGNPFPKVEVCIGKQITEDKYDILAQGNSKQTTVTKGMEGEQGELLVKGPNVFREYWNKPEATKSSFTSDGWFKTGDTAVYTNGVYKIVGRTSVDIIKSGGYKISALDVERHLLAHPDITDIAVVGLPDTVWGQIVAAVIVLENGKELELNSLKTWAKNLMPPYQIPVVLKCLPTMPRNAMGKVNKKELVKTVFPEYLNDS